MLDNAFYKVKDNDENNRFRMTNTSQDAIEMHL
jgi:hypothetical protein